MMCLAKGRRNKACTNKARIGYTTCGTHRDLETMEAVKNDRVVIRSSWKGSCGSDGKVGTLVEYREIPSEDDEGRRALGATVYGLVKFDDGTAILFNPNWIKKVKEVVSEDNRS